jgi:hypothetical protein
VQVGAGGTLNLTAGGTETGTFSIASGATMELSSAITFDGTSSTGLGQLKLASSTLTVNSTASLGSGFTHAAGTLSGSGTVTVTGLGSFTGVSTYMMETGSGTTDLQGGGVLSSGILALDGGRKLQNDGTFNWTGGSISLGQNPLGTTIGGATINNMVGATFNDQVAGSITNSTGTNVFNNAGTFNTSFATGTTTIGVTFNNTGTVHVQSGTLTFTGSFSNSGILIADGGNIQIITAVNDSGTATIFGTSQLQYGASSNEDVTFAMGATGTLILVNSSGYTGHVSGFTGTADGNPATSDKIDLRDIGFATVTESYSNNLLTISDGVHTAHINFVGNYQLTNFHFSNDGFGGTLITDPPVAQQTVAAENDGVAGSLVPIPSSTESAAAAVASPFAAIPGDNGAIISDTNGGTTIVRTHQAPVIETDDMSIVQNPDGTNTVLGLLVEDSNPLSSTETFIVSGGTEAALAGLSTTASPSSGSLADINGALASGVTYHPGSILPGTEKTTLSVTDSVGATDSTTFIFNQFEIGSNVTLQGTSGKDVIFATNNQDVLTGGAGQDQFLFEPTSSGPSVQHTITDFELGIDKLDVRQFSGFSAASIAGAIQQQGSDTLISLDPHDTLLLKNVFAASVHASDFIVHA